MPLFLFATRDEVDIDSSTEEQHTVDDRATDQFFPMAAGGLTKHKLCHRMFASGLNQRFGDITALYANDRGTEVFGKDSVFFQVALCGFAIPGCLSAIFDKADEFACEGKVAFWLDGNGNQVGMQAVSQPPGVA